MKNILLAIILITSFTCSNAQKHEIYDKGIASLQVVAGQNWLSLPIIRLNGNSPNDKINISFDDLTHTYHRYTYKIEHCQADWNVSDQLFSSDFINGFQDGNTIDNSIESINTNTLYTHYTLQIPNERCSLKMSGNYKLTVFDENDDNRPVFTACFMVVEPLMGVQLDVTTNTDIDINKSHQQVSMAINYGTLNVHRPKLTNKNSCDAKPKMGQCKNQRQAPIHCCRRLEMGTQQGFDIPSRKRIQKIRDFRRVTPNHGHRPHSMGRQQLPSIPIPMRPASKLCV